jgi:spore germination protein YaaH
MAPPIWVPSAQRLTEKRLWVLGYTAEDYPEDLRSLESIRRYHTHLDAIAHFAYQLDEDASFLGEINSTLIQESLSNGIAPLILIHNFNGQFFDPQPLRSLLSSITLQERFIQNLLNLLPNGVAGVHIDFEGIEASYRLAYNTFLEGLRASLHAKGFLLTIAVPAKRSEWEAPGYDFAAIGRICDAITLMTYDEHYAGGEAGPIASLPWMTQALDYTIQFIPQQKILIGIPAYGYDWSSGTTNMIPMKDIPTLVKQTGARILWNDPAVEPYFYYWEGRIRHTVWFESELSAKIRFGFIKSYHLRGIAIWRLGYETSRFWQAIGSKLK